MENNTSDPENLSSTPLVSKPVETKLSNSEIDEVDQPVETQTKLSKIINRFKENKRVAIIITIVLLIFNVLIVYLISSSAKSDPELAISDKPTPTPKTTQSPENTTTPISTYYPSPSPLITAIPSPSPTPESSSTPTSIPEPKSTPTPTPTPTPNPLVYSQDANVSQVSPQEFQVGDTVTITGESFGEYHLEDDIFINFNCNNIIPRIDAEIVSWTDKEIKFIAPSQPYECQWSLSCGYLNRENDQWMLCQGNNGTLVKEPDWFDWVN